MKIDVNKLLHEMHVAFKRESDPDYSDDLTMATMQIGIMRGILLCEDIVKDLIKHGEEPELKPCDPILMSYSMEDFLKVVDDAKCFGLEVVIHNGKPYYRETT